MNSAAHTDGAENMNAATTTTGADTMTTTTTGADNMIRKGGRVITKTLPGWGPGHKGTVVTEAPASTQEGKLGWRRIWIRWDERAAHGSRVTPVWAWQVKGR